MSYSTKDDFLAAIRREGAPNPLFIGVCDSKLREIIAQGSDMYSNEKHAARAELSRRVRLREALLR